jgi:hypothetical protein
MDASLGLQLRWQVVLREGADAEVLVTLLGASSHVRGPCRCFPTRAKLATLPATHRIDPGSLPSATDLPGCRANLVDVGNLRQGD